MNLDLILLITGWVVLGCWVLNVGPLLFTRQRKLKLQTDGMPPSPALPAITVVVPARDEAGAIEACLRSLLDSDYPSLRVVAVDDRSTDGTGAVMDRLAREDARLEVVHVTELPEGWLGKNHALQVGAKRAQGEFILFTDGDVVFEPDALRRAVVHAQAQRLDHLCLFPSLIPGDYWENTLVCFFGMLFTAGTGFWLVRTRLKFIYIGVGAFNLVRRAAYESAGGHHPIRLDVADDLKLGRLMKQAGGRADALFSEGLVRVKWQTSFWGVIRGLEKNAFAAMGYSVWKLLAGTLLYVLFAFVPYAGAILLDGPARWGFVLTLVVMHSAYGLAGRDFGTGWRTMLALPVAAGGLLLAIWRSAVVTLRQGGVRWRETFYPIELLRANIYR